MVRKYQVELLAALCTLLLVGICLSVDRAGSAAAPLKAAVFPFELIDTSHEGELAGKREDETQRLRQLDQILQARIQESERYETVDLSPIAELLKEEEGRLHKCNGCAAEFAKKAGADIAISGWVQKVSNLILNVNIEIRDAGTNKVIQVASADIRGNTDESWRRGLEYLLRNRILKAQASGG